MYIRIIDDDKEVSNIIKERLQEHINKLFINFELEVINDNFDSVNYDMYCDIYIIATEFEGNNGIEIIREIRSLRYNPVIIFISSNNDLIFDTFDLRPFYFIRKDSLDNDLNKMFKMLSKYLEKNYKIITLDVRGGRKTAIPLNEILYLESFEHDFIVVTTKDRYLFTGTFDKVNNFLNSKNLVRVHKSFEVNLYWIKEVKELQIILYNDIIIDIGRAYYDQFCIDYKEYKSI